MEYRVTCKDCGSFITELHKSFDDTLKCSGKCKKMKHYKIVFMSDLIKNHKHGAKK